MIQWIISNIWTIIICAVLIGIVRCADRHCRRDHSQYGQKETQGKVNGL